MLVIQINIDGEVDMNNKEQSQSTAHSEQETRTFICNFSLPLGFISVINVICYNQYTNKDDLGGAGINVEPLILENPVK